jgi:hypothetical protein
MKKSYRVRWEIDIDATSYVEAAKEALKIQRDPGGEATYFEVSNLFEDGESESVDISL